MKPIDIVNVILNVMFISSFICVFFFTIGSKLEKKVFEMQIKNVTSELLGGIVNMLPENVKEEIKFSIDEIKVSTDADPAAAQHNKELFQMVIKSLVYFVVVCLIACYYVQSSYSIPNDEMIECLKENAITIAFVGLTYAVFTILAGLNFRSADANYVRKSIIEELEKKIVE
jgi:hypothetical protein